jgi:hypothetical protein
MPNSFLEPEGLFNPALRFAFTNITDDVFVSYWDKIPITVKPHETIEIGPTTPIVGVGHALAVKMTGELVDKIMINLAKMDELNHKDIPYYRSPDGTAMGVPAARQVWEVKILRELKSDEDSPSLQSLRNQLKEEILSRGDAHREPAPIMPKSIEEFADLTKKPEEVKKPEAKVKKVRKPKTQINTQENV